MESHWLTIPQIEIQERNAKIGFEDFWGKGREGFCDFAPDGIELMLQGIWYLINHDELNDEGNFKDFDHAVRGMTYYHYYRVVFSFKGVFNLSAIGYYTESAILLRSIIETFVRLKYIAKSRNIDYIGPALAGHYVFQGKRFKVGYKTQFDDIAPGLYKYYRLLCDMAHGAVASHILKKPDDETKDSGLDSGIVFKPLRSIFVLNQFAIYLLAHLLFMMRVFPEIETKMPEAYAAKYHKTLAVLWDLMSTISTKEENHEWYNSVKTLVSVNL